MPIICIGPICIPWFAVYPLLLYFVRPVYHYVMKLMGKEIPKDENAEKPSEKSIEDMSKTSQDSSGPVMIKSMEDWEALMEVSKSQSKGVVLDYYSTWCKPCEAIRPTFEKLCKEYPGLIFAKVNVDDVADLAMRYDVFSMPTFHFFKSGKRLEGMEVKGGTSHNKLEASVAHLAKKEQ
uniref:Thioredoxin domain-containing protein n=1 Tax=Fibrocapsa japonica TaxID=94617 RepID=A0A7S2XY67_9STRA|mmetsp:Transcript_2191/g.3248  ORF Transcript_2191/g.3248 Transcript_2191/m.3248 type:complete len:179 (+) Transcript_2191:116-652(+)|eukprot:CAMPEP_0113937428 /NCGR_PEP_ID=MMETSP1339-20121228/4058_1 /TAXON_ID=94617 /ORGANISM="Fibrocapsa japonica" /LENGTH=178 /DNA_ID=CAMNT_0000940189 /DNA_START=114 /DNA_END=650 /DNA_ORIENTATION=+ /assembly_acc=CAM_ASM_000762